MKEKQLIPSALSTIQFSLSTLLILTVFIGALVGAWIRRNPFEVSWIDPVAAKRQLTNYSEDKMVDLYRAEWDKKPRYVVIRHSELIKEGEWVDAIASGICSAPEGFSFQVRKQNYPDFPNHWWGHLFRVEVWVSIVSGGVLMVRAWRNILRRPLKFPA